jgi:hypothetical protein
MALRSPVSKNGVAGDRLDQVVNGDHGERALEIDRVLEVVVHQDCHERHLPGVLGHALAAAAGEPAVPQLGLEPLGQAQDLEDALDVVAHGALPVLGSAGVRLPGVDTA